MTHPVAGLNLDSLECVNVNILNSRRVLSIDLILRSDTKENTKPTL